MNNKNNESGLIRIIGLILLYILSNPVAYAYLTTGRYYNGTDGNSYLITGPSMSSRFDYSARLGTFSGTATYLRITDSATVEDNSTGRKETFSVKLVGFAEGAVAHLQNEQLKSITFDCDFSLIPNLLMNRPKLEYVDVGNQKKIPDDFCLYSKKLKTVTSNGYIEIIGKRAFKGCTNLKELPNMPKLTKIEESAFFDCWLDCSIEFPSTLKSIGSSAFGFGESNPWKVPQIDKIICNSLIPPEITGEGFAFSDVTHQNTVLYVPLESIDLYKNAYEWKEFKSIRYIGEVEATSIRIDKNSVTLKAEESIELMATVFPETTRDKTVVWSSSNVNIATVDANGIVKAVAIGSANITACTVNGLKASCKVNVVETPVTDIDIDKDSMGITGNDLEMQVGDVKTILTTVRPKNATNKVLIYSSDNPNVASVTTLGKISALSVGISHISITAQSGVTSQIVVKVLPTPVTALSIIPEQTELKVGETLNPSVTFTPENATDKNLTWTSSDAKIATVDNEGKITAKGLGQCAITATSANGVSAFCIVSVVPTPPEELSLDKHEAILYVGDSIKLNAEILPETTTDKTIIWTSSESSVATVDPEGLANAAGIGESVITAKCGALTAECIIKVVETPATSLAIDKTSVKMHVAESVQLTAIILPENATNKNVVWDSFNESVATVNDSGLVMAEKEGSAIIRAKCGSLTALCQINVIDTESESISLDVSQVSLKITEKIQLTATVLPENTTDKSVVWSTSDSSIANVDKTGLVTALSIGSAAITATCGDVSATCAVSVIPTPVESISFGMMEVTLKPTETVQMDATVSPPTATIKDLVWSSSDTSVAIVDGYGLVTAVSPGQCFVTASAGDGSNISANCVVTVKPVLIESIHLDTPGWKGVKGDCFQIIATIAPEDATDKTLIWTSSDESIASVDDTGMVTAVGVGECLITASAADGSGISASCEVSLDPILVESLTISPEEFLGAKGDSFMIIPTILPENADNKRLEYKSGNEGVAEVDSMGSVTVKDNGSAVITVRTTDGSDIEAECVITSVSGIDSLFTDDSSRFDVYDITGIMLRKNADKEYVRHLSKGVYIIVAGNKFIKLNLTGD